MLEINGFPPCSGYIELPDLPDLLRTPFFRLIDADFAYKHGDELTRHLINLTPIKNDQKYVTISSFVQYLTPGYGPVRSDILSERDWHIDSTGLVSKDITYLLLSNSDCNTEFNSVPLCFDNFHGDSDHGEFARYINYNDVGLVPKALEGNRIATFGCSDMHRAGKPLKPEFRFMWRVTESDFLNPLEVSELSYKHSYVYKYRIPFLNIKQTEDGVIIY